MAAIHDDVYDDGLNGVDTLTENLHILSADPGLTWSNIATYLLGTKATPSIAAPSDRSGGGREVVVAAITDGSCSADGTATHYALTDDSATKILVSGALASSIGVSNGGTFATTEFVVGIPDPA